MVLSTTVEMAFFKKVVKAKHSITPTVGNKALVHFPNWQSVVLKEKQTS